MIITFLGTKGYIEKKSPEHKFHTSTLINYKRKKILIDWGEDWKGKLNNIKPHAILITHAHPDHCFGLEEVNAPLPIYATEDTACLLKEFLLPSINIIRCYKEFEIFDLTILAYQVSHSIRCPAVGYKIKAEGLTFVYNPDLVFIDRQEEILSKVDIYIGDGSSITRSLVRRKNNLLYGHTSIRAQINWCKKFGIKKAYFTHFGNDAIRMTYDELQKNLHSLGEQQMEVIAAYDGMKINFRTVSQ